MTEIDAINRMLRYIGELPIPSTVSIDSLPEGHEAVISRTILAETLREEQENKWWFNTFDVTFVPDTDGYITLPPNLIEFESIEYFREGGNLYTRDPLSGVFTDPVELTCRLEITFDNIPDVFRTYVVLVASKHLHVYLNGDDTTQKELDNKVNLQRIKVEREHLKQSKFNLVRGNRLIDRGTNPTALI
jgi:hypothetical protein